MDTEKMVKEKFDWTLLFILFLFFIVSMVAISSAQPVGDQTNYALRQAMIYGAGAIIVAAAIIFDPGQYKMMSWYLYGFGILVLIFLLFAPTSMLAGPDPERIKSWLRVPLIGTLQPSEFMKTFLILAGSNLITNHHKKYTEKTTQTDFWLLAKIGVTAGLPILLVFAQNDLGTALVFIAITLGLVLVSGITWKIFLPSLLSIGLVGAGALWLVLYHPEFLKDQFGIEKYKFDRIYTWIDPYSYAQNEGYNLIQVLNAIGSGQLSGKGYQEKEVFVPEQHTDFIYSVIGEEFGFIGASFVIVLFFFLIYHLIRIAMATNNPFNSYVCAGIISMITFHVLENIGMSLQLLPITGIPLPFISYGGSSLLGNMLAMGIIFSIRYHHKTYFFTTEEEE